MLDVVAMRNGKMRGQAHVAFRDVQASTQAMRALQGFEFFGKELVSAEFFFTSPLVGGRVIEHGTGGCQC